MSNQSRQPPRWAQIRIKSGAATSETPDTGLEPPCVPRLPTRLLPFNGRHGISSITLSDVVATTQRILTCISYEVVYQASSDVIDLRSAGSEVAALSKLTIQPFDEGSFVIPASLTEERIIVNGREYTGADVLSRFAEVMQSVSDHSDVPASITILQAVEELGKITRREAFVEYQPMLPLQPRGQCSRIVVDNSFISQVSAVRKRRVDPQQRLDTIEGTLTAIDIENLSLQLRMDDKTVVRGFFGEFARPLLMQSINKRVKLSGTITLERRRITRVRVVLAESAEET